MSVRGTARWPGSLAGLVVALTLTACGPAGGDDDVDGDQARAALEQQRTDVRAAARELLLAAEARLPGRTGASTGSWRGCESGGLEEFRNFRYLAQARVDLADGDTARALELLDAVLTEAGFEVGGVTPGPGARRSLHAERGEVRAAFADTGGGPFVGLTVTGPCVDVPEDEREDWLRRDEPTPRLL